MRRLVLASILPALLLACAPKAEVDELSEKVAALEDRVATLETRPAGPDEVGGDKAYQELVSLLQKGDMNAAKAAVNDLLKDYQGTKAASRAVRLKQELDVVGKKVSTSDVEEWYVGSGSDLDFADGTTLVVFWEVWCPHCQREVPELQALHEKYDDKLKIVGLTRLTKSATKEKVVDFIEQKNVTYPMAKEKGDIAKLFNVSGIPAAAVVKDGEVVWRGHPGRLSEDMLETWI